MGNHASHDIHDGDSSSTRGIIGKQRSTSMTHINFKRRINGLHQISIERQLEYMTTSTKNQQHQTRSYYMLFTQHCSSWAMLECYTSRMLSKLGRMFSSISTGRSEKENIVPLGIVFTVDAAATLHARETQLLNGF